MSKFIAKYHREKIVTRKMLKNGCEHERTTTVPTGVITAMRDDSGKVKFGWSSCLESDTFKKKFALELAKRRIQKGVDKPVPSSISSLLYSSDFLDRCEAYFGENVEAPLFFKIVNNKKCLCRIADVNAGFEVLEYNPTR